MKYEVMQMVLNSKLEFFYTDSDYKSRKFFFLKKGKKLNNLVSKIHDIVLNNHGKFEFFINGNQTVVKVSE